MKAFPQELNHAIHWFDDSVLSLNKPSGWLSIPDGYDPDNPHSRSMLQPHFGRLWVVHHLDRETSGLMVMARSSAAHRALNLRFKRGEVEKSYSAIVEGEPAWSSLRLELALGHPVLGDPLFGPRLPGSDVLIERLALHASRLKFLHPVRLNAKLFEMHPPPDMGRLGDYPPGSGS